ncbi:MAG: SH3 domain-containing protein [Actinobacteria bacterium]|nr:SH3 domain-containing protein [Actinomycetota bacterium]
MERRRAHAQTAVVSLDHGWNPGLLLMMVTLGLIVGLGLGLKDQVFRKGLDRDDSYLILASTLYGQDPTPAVAGELRQRLSSLGFANPSVTVLKLADRFAASRDRQMQREAEGLRILGEALNVVVDAPAAARSVPTATAQATGVATAPAVAPASDTPVPQSSPVATPSAPAPAPAAATAAPTAARSPESPQGPQGTIKSADKQPAVLRREPSTLSGKVALIPFGAKVQILQTVNGKADDPNIDPKELRWYQVKWGSYTGYVYYKLIATGG